MFVNGRMHLLYESRVLFTDFIDNHGRDTGQGGFAGLSLNTSDEVFGCLAVFSKILVTLMLQVRLLNCRCTRVSCPVTKMIDNVVFLRARVFRVSHAKYQITQGLRPIGEILLYKCLKLTINGAYILGLLNTASINLKLPHNSLISPPITRIVSFSKKSNQ